MRPCPSKGWPFFNIFFTQKGIDKVPGKRYNIIAPGKEGETRGECDLWLDASNYGGITTNRGTAIIIMP